MSPVLRGFLPGLIGLVLAAAWPAAAAQVPFTGTLSISFRGTGDAPEQILLQAPGSGTANVSLDGAVSALTIPAGAFATTVDGALSPLNETITLMMATVAVGCDRDGQQFTVACVAPTGSLGGFGALRGGNLMIPLSGIGGATGTPSLTGDGWAGPPNAAAFARTRANVRAGLVIGRGTSDVEGPVTTDTISLVSPFRVAAPSDQPSPVGLARVTIHLVPEPGTLLLLGFGVAGLACYGRRSRRSRPRS